MTNILGSTKPVDSIQGATALDMSNSIKPEEETLMNQKEEAIQEPNEEISKGINLESEKYLQTLESNSSTQEPEVTISSDVANDSEKEMVFSDKDMNQTDETMSLFSDDNSFEAKDDLKIETKEQEMFENQDEEKDFEIPAFLRRQKN